MASPDTLPNVSLPPAAGLDPRAVCRNGVPPSAQGVLALAGLLHHCAGGRLKLLGQFSQLPPDALDTSADTVIYRAMCHTSPDCDKVVLDLVLAPAKTTSIHEMTPTVYLVSQTADISAQPATLAATTTKATVVYSVGKTAAIVPNDYLYESRGFALSPNTTYALELHSSDQARVLAATIWERSRTMLSASSDVVALDLSRLRRGGPIYDADNADLLASINTMWKRGGRTLIRWSRTDGSYTSRASATAANLFDQTLTAWGAQNPGFFVYPGDAGNLVGAADPVICWAYAGLSAAGADGTITFRRNGATITDVVVSATTGYYSNSATLNSANASDKVDILVAGNGTQSIRVYAAGMFEFVT